MSGNRGKSTPINLQDFDEFEQHKWIQEIIIPKYKRQVALAEYAHRTLVDDLETLNQEYKKKHDRYLFSSVDGRPKKLKSTLEKLRERCQSSNQGITKITIQEIYASIKDICGVRFSCPYFDEVEYAITEVVRPGLRRLNGSYQVDLTEMPEYEDENWLDKGDEDGYRSYHFYVRVPTAINIYDEIESCICEVQARSEIQHVWAVKSHDLLYKPGLIKIKDDKIRDKIKEDMKQISNSLRSVDHALGRIRDTVQGGLE